MHKYILAKTHTNCKAQCVQCRTQENNQPDSSNKRFFFQTNEEFTSARKNDTKIFYKLK